jgi:lipoyl(octanoyl) transferase
MEIEVIDPGLRPYGEVWDLQHELFGGMVDRKRRREVTEREYLILVEHNPVVTLGKHAKEMNMLRDEDTLRRMGVDCFHIERGGDVTYHGPGQLVAYPILDLEAHHLGVKDYVHLLEESVIQTIADYGIKGERVEGASGVWIGKGTPGERKICALGVKCSRFCTMHGLALNVNTDLRGFSLINPCGFIDKGVTSMQRERGEEIDFEDVKNRFRKKILNLLGY